MSKYYCLIAGLPKVSPDDTKLTYSVADFKSEIDTLLSNSDRRLIQWIFLKYDNANLIAYLRKLPKYEFNTLGLLSEENLKEVVENGKIHIENLVLPLYFTEFINKYKMRFNTPDEDSKLSWDDSLSASYYNAAMKCGNEFLSSWFEMNLNIGNIMTALNCRKFNIDKKDYIIGDNEIAEQLRQSNSRDFGLGDSFEYMDELRHITEEHDLTARERRLDLLRWNWLEENTFFKTFDIESVIAYLLRLVLVERWIKLDKTNGEKEFRRIVGAMKKGSADILDEFKKNNIKL